MNRLVLIPLLALVGCGEPINEEARREAREAAEGPGSSTARVPAPPVAAPQPLPSSPDTAASSPVQGPSFVGRWAASPELCTRPFVLTADQIATPGGVSCRLTRVTATNTGWTADALCTAEGPPAPARLVLAREGDGLRITGAPFDAVSLRLCGENWGRPEDADPASALGAAAPPTNP